MGTGCSTYRSVHVHAPTPSRDKSVEVAKCNEISEEKKVERRIKFENESNELSFIEIASPRNGVVIKWRKGDIIGEGAFATVFQCIDLIGGRLMAVKSFKVIEK